MSDEGWDQAVEGCDFVMHVASPFISKIPKDENDLIYKTKTDAYHPFICLRKQNKNT